MTPGDMGRATRPPMSKNSQGTSERCSHFCTEFLHTFHPPHDPGRHVSI
jgi:hypothetical protein